MLKVPGTALWEHWSFLHDLTPPPVRMAHGFLPCLQYPLSNFPMQHVVLPKRRARLGTPTKVLMNPTSGSGCPLLEFGRVGPSQNKKPTLWCSFGFPKQTHPINVGVLRFSLQNKTPQQGVSSKRSRTRNTPPFFWCRVSCFSQVHAPGCGTHSAHPATRRTGSIGTAAVSFGLKDRRV